MPNETHVQRVQLGCGTLILIALIVIFFSRGSNTDDVEREIRGLRSEMGELKKLIEGQSSEIRQLREKLSPPSPKVSVEKGKD